ncbi:MAG: hypothetical protein ACYCZB_03050 [Acidiphilium sp.]
MSAAKPCVLKPHPCDAEALLELREIAEDRFARPSHRVEARCILKAYARATCRQHQLDALAAQQVERPQLVPADVEANYSDAARAWWQGW